MKKLLVLFLTLSAFFIINNREDEIEKTIITDTINDLMEVHDVKAVKQKIENDKTVTIVSTKRKERSISIKKTSSHKIADLFHDRSVDQTELLKLAEDSIDEELLCLDSKECRQKIVQNQRWGDEFHNHKTKTLESSLKLISLGRESGISKAKLTDDQFNRITALDNAGLRSLALELKLTQEDIGENELVSIFKSSKDWAGSSLVTLFESVIKSDHFEKPKLKKLILDELKSRLAQVDAHSSLLMAESTLSESKSIFSNTELSYVFSGSCQNKKELKRVGAWNLLKNKIQTEKNIRNISGSLVQGCGV